MEESSSPEKKDVVSSIDKLKSLSNDEDFINKAQNIVASISDNLQSYSIDEKIIEELINKQYIPLIEIIFEKMPNFIDKENKKYNSDYIILLIDLYDKIINIFEIIKSFLNKAKFRNIINIFFNKCYNNSFKLLEILQPYDELISKEFGENNPVIFFNEKNINLMKSKIFEFFTYIISNLSLNDEGNKIKLTNVIELIIESLKDIINDEKKFNFFKNYDRLKKIIKNKEIDSHGLLLYQMFVFLQQEFIIKIFINDFNFLAFLINVILVFAIIEDKLFFTENNYEKYITYFNDKNNIVDKYLTCSTRFIRKIIIDPSCSDIFKNFLIFNIEMIDYALNEKKTLNLNKYTYLKDINNLKIVKFDDETKLNISLLFYIIYGKVSNGIFLNFDKNLFMNTLNEHFEKINLLTSPIIKIKLCLLFRYINCNWSNSNSANIIANIFNFLLNNIKENSLQEKAILSKLIVKESSKTLMKLLKLRKKEKYLQLYSQIFEKHLKDYIVLIENINNLDLIDIMIGDLKIGQKNMLFDLINNLTKKVFKNNDESFSIKYFRVLKLFLIKENKINNIDKEEILKIKDIVEPILKNIKNQENLELYNDDFFLVVIEYIKLLGVTNHESALVLQKLEKLIPIKNSQIFFDFLIDLISIIQKNINISNEHYKNNDLFNEIISIISNIFTNYNDDFDFEHILIITLKILNLVHNLNTDFLSILLNKCSKLLSNDNNSNYFNQLILFNISLGFIYYPDITFKILNSTLNDNKISNFISYINSLMDFDDSENYLDNQEYNYFVRKYVLLGICGIFTNQSSVNYLDDNKKEKKILLNHFILIIQNQIDQLKEMPFLLKKSENKDEKSPLIVDKNEKKDLKKEDKYDDIDDENILFDLKIKDDSFEDKDENEKKRENFIKNVEKVIKDNNNINNCNELKLISQILKYIRKYDFEIYNSILSEVFQGDIIEKIDELKN